MKSGRAIERIDLDVAVQAGVVTSEQVRELLRIAEQRCVQQPGLNVQQLAFYLGGLLVIGAMGWFVTSAWDDMGGIGFLLTSAGYASAFTCAGAALWSRPGGRTPGGVLIALAVSMIPMGVYGAQVLTGFWPSGSPAAYHLYPTRIRSGWLLMEAATVFGGALAVRRFRFPFLAAPIALALWFMSMDFTALLAGGGEFSWDQRRQVTLWFGLFMLSCAYVLDRRTREDFAFWGYLFGLMAFWGALTAMDSASELARLGYLAVNVGLLGLAVLLERRTFLVFGGAGVCLYLGHLAYRVFADSLAFPFVLSLIGLAVMALGWAYQRRAAALEAAVLARLPEWLLCALPRGRVR